MFRPLWKVGHEEVERQLRRPLTDDVHWITSRQLSPSPVTKRNHSPASLSLHSSCSKDSSFFGTSSSFAWRFHRSATSPAISTRINKSKNLTLENYTRQLGLEIWDFMFVRAFACVCVSCYACGLWRRFVWFGNYCNRLAAYSLSAPRAHVMNNSFKESRRSDYPCFVCCACVPFDCVCVRVECLYNECPLNM